LHRHRGSPALASVRRIVVGNTDVRIEVESNNASTNSPESPAVISVPIRLCRRGNATEIRLAGATYLSALLPLAFLAPDLTEAILDGRQPQWLTLAHARPQRIPLDWNAQRELFAHS
jgi:hypothetical protein